MHLVTFLHNGQSELGLLNNPNVIVLPPTEGWPCSLLDLIESGPETWQRLQAAAPTLARTATCRPLEALRLLAPIPRPRKNVMCIGWNYAEHVSESAAASKREDNVPTDPVVFTKSVTSVAGPHDDIPAQPDVTTQLDWEVELGVIIGTGGRAIPRERALAHVFGYTVINDISARDLQFRHKQFFLGKSLDGTCPMGPVVVTADEIPDPQNLNLRCRVNGALKQDSNTRHMIFDVATIISVLSRGMTLEPGDIIATGTPSGVGFARQPPEYLRAGDVVECEIDGIGRLRNRLV